jgi:site-specific recombinase XerD
LDTREKYDRYVSTSFLHLEPIVVRSAEGALVRDDAGGLVARFNQMKELAEIHDGTTLIVLRKTFATLLRREGVDAAIRADLMGHTEIGSQQFYADTTFDESYGRALKAWRTHHASQDPADGE